MSNGFATVEQGNSTSHSIRFWLKWINRISFSRDLPVRRVSFISFERKIFKEIVIDEFNQKFTLPKKLNQKITYSKTLISDPERVVCLVQGLKRLSFSQKQSDFEGVQLST